MQQATLNEGNNLISSYLYPYVQQMAQWLAKLPNSPCLLHIWMFSPCLYGCWRGALIASQTCMLVISNITPHNLDQTSDLRTGVALQVLAAPK